MESKKWENTAGVVFISVIIGFAFLIALRVVTKNVLYDSLHINNKFVQIILAGQADVERDMKLEKGTPINWEEEYPFTNVVTADEAATETSSVEKKYFENYTAKFDAIKEKLQIYCNSELPFKDVMIQCGALYNTAVGYTIPMGSDDVLVINNERLAYVNGSVETQEIADSVKSLSDYTADKGIDFLYVQTPSKVYPFSKQVPYGAVEYSNENTTELLNNLQENGVDVLDYRDYLPKDVKDWYSSFYKSDQHWKTRTAFDSVGILGEYLNDHYSYQFDLNLFNIKNYQTETYENKMYGPQAKAVFADKELYTEDFDLILPRFNTNLNLQVKETELNRTGTFEELFFDKEVLTQISDDGPDAYHTAIVQNNALFQIRNLEKTNNQKKILMIQDSMCWYFTPYLALDVAEIDAIYTANFNGSIRSYIEQTKPDMVIVMMIPRNISEINWGSHTSFYDFR